MCLWGVLVLVEGRVTGDAVVERCVVCMLCW
jgi:hypothetical protein